MIINIGDMLKYKSQAEMGYCVVKDLYSHYESGLPRIKIMWLAYSYKGHDNMQDIGLSSDYSMESLEKSKFWSKLS